MEDSLWRQPYLADLTYGELHRLVDEFVIGNGLRILDLGCGTGYISLELAREGHDVTGVDSNEEAIGVAVNTMNSDPYRSERGKLRYVTADFAKWDDAGSKYDLVVACRVLHHIRELEGALSKVHLCLNPGGRIISVEFAYDLFEKRAATWLYHVRRILEQAGWYKSERPLPGTLEEAVRQILDEWLEEHEGEERMNRFAEMHEFLGRFFREDHFSWLPYHYWTLLEKTHVPSNEVEVGVARSLSAIEDSLVQSGQISSVLFCYVGEKPSHATLIGANQIALPLISLAGRNRTEPRVQHPKYT